MPIGIFSPCTDSFYACEVSDRLRLSIPQIRRFSSASDFTLLILRFLVVTFVPLFFLEIGSPLFTMVLNYWVLLSNLMALPRLGLPPERASIGLLVCCAEYFSEQTLSTLHSSEGFPGPCNNHVFFAPVDALIGWPTFFVLRLPSRPFLGLVGEVASPPYRFLRWPSRLDSTLVGILEGFPPFVDLFSNFHALEHCTINWALRGGEYC